METYVITWSFFSLISHVLGMLLVVLWYFFLCGFPKFRMSPRVMKILLALLGLAALLPLFFLLNPNCAIPGSLLMSYVLQGIFYYVLSMGLALVIILPVTILAFAGVVGGYTFQLASRYFKKFIPDKGEN